MLLETNEGDEPDRAIKIDKNVKITVRTLLPPCPRAENGKLRDRIMFA